MFEKEVIFLLKGKEEKQPTNTTTKRVPIC
jgi:hypothetical protein